MTDLHSFLVMRLRAVLTPSKNPDEWVTTSTLCTLYGMSRAKMLDAVWDAKFTDEEGERICARWRTPL